MNMEHLWKKSLPYICGALAVALAYTILYCLHPVLYDDWNYLEQMQGFLADPSPRSWWHDFSVGVIQRYTLDNIRLANILYLLICPLPQWIPSLIAGGALFITFLFGARLAGVWRRNLFAFAAMIALYMCIEPWYEGMLLKTFAFNYSLPSALALWSARMILRQKPPRNNRRHPLRLHYRLVARSIHYQHSRWHPHARHIIPALPYTYHRHMVCRPDLSNTHPLLRSRHCSTQRRNEHL